MTRIAIMLNVRCRRQRHTRLPRFDIQHPQPLNVAEPHQQAPNSPIRLITTSVLPSLCFFDVFPAKTSIHADANADADDTSVDDAPKPTAFPTTHATTLADWIASLALVITVQLLSRRRRALTHPTATSQLLDTTTPARNGLPCAPDSLIVPWEPLPSLQSLQRSLVTAQRCGAVVDCVLADGLPSSLKPAMLQVRLLSLFVHDIMWWLQQVLVCSCSAAHATAKTAQALASKAATLLRARLAQRAQHVVKELEDEQASVASLGSNDADEKLDSSFNPIVDQHNTTLRVEALASDCTPQSDSPMPSLETRHSADARLYPSGGCAADADELARRLGRASVDAQLGCKTEGGQWVWHDTGLLLAYIADAFAQVNA